MPEPNLINHIKEKHYTIDFDALFSVLQLLRLILPLLQIFSCYKDARVDVLANTAAMSFQ
jgi:hypothetical protein